MWSDSPWFCDGEVVDFQISSTDRLLMIPRDEAGKRREVSYSYSTKPITVWLPNRYRNNPPSAISVHGYLSLPSRWLKLRLGWIGWWSHLESRVGMTISPCRKCRFRDLTSRSVRFQEARDRNVSIFRWELILWRYENCVAKGNMYLTAIDRIAVTKFEMHMAER